MRDHRFPLPVFLAERPDPLNLLVVSKEYYGNVILVYPLYKMLPLFPTKPRKVGELRSHGCRIRHADVAFGEAGRMNARCPMS